MTENHTTIYDDNRLHLQSIWYMIYARFKYLHQGKWDVDGFFTVDGFQNKENVCIPG